MKDLWLAVLATLALLTACTQADPARSQAPGASLRSEESDCLPIDILAPSGTKVALTGVWRSNDQGIYVIQQQGSCLYWMGRSQDVGFEPGDGWTNVLVATVRSDFTIVGRWGDVPLSPDAESSSLGEGSMTLRIDFDRSDGVERPVLRMVNASGEWGQAAQWIAGFTGYVWVLEESLSTPTELQGTFGGTEEPDCAWIESNGQRYQLIGSGEWTMRPSPLSLRDGLGHIVARLGDPLRVRGRVAAALGSGCADTAILVEELDPTP